MYNPANPCQATRLAALQADLSAAVAAAAELPRYHDEERARAFLPFRSKAAATRYAGKRRAEGTIMPILGGFCFVRVIVHADGRIVRLAEGRAYSYARVRDLENLEFYG